MLSKQETWELAKKLRYSLKIQNAMGFSDTPITPPDIDFYEDQEQFFNSEEHIIHIGAYGITDRFCAETEEDFLEALNYVRGHEEEHCRSTAQRPYSIGIQKGCEEVLKYISSKEDKVTRRFRTPQDYETYANVTLPGMGIHVNWGMVQRIIGGIANSLEDGRIERIRSARFPGYERLRVKYRGIFWSQTKEKDNGIDPEKNPAEKLRLVTNNILTLATCQLYTNGFAMRYSGQPVVDEVNSYMPNIARAYMANRCKDMSVEVIEIAKGLAPLIYEVCKISATDIAMRKILEDIIRKMIESSIENNVLDPGGKLQENEEMTGNDEMPKPTFPVSDLVITLPDDVYDKLEKNSDSKEGNIMVKREHPKEDEKNPEKRSKGQSEGSQQEQKEDGQKSDKSSNKEAGKSSDSDDSGTGVPESSGTEDNASEGSSSGSCTDGKANKDNEIPEKAAETESKKGDTESDSGKGNGRGTSENSDNNIDAVLKAMEEASEQTREEAKETISNINTHVAHEHRTREKTETIDKEPVVPEEIGNLIGHRFKEVKRMYKVKDKLPPVLQARGKAMYRKNQRYFKSLSKPTVKNLDSGSVDPGRIYGLSFGDTEVFQKTGKDKQFDGCAYMLIDNSGSMRGNKRIESAKAGAVVEEGFRKMFPLKIVAFDEDGPIIHEVIKNWDEWLSQNCCWNYALHGREGCGNEDGYDIQVATRELLSRPEKKKMLVILSDGAPGSRSLVNKAVKDARKKGIEVYSIYFEEGDVSARAEETMKTMYERDYVVCPLDELDEHLYKLFKKFSRA